MNAQENLRGGRTQVLVTGGGGYVGSQLVPHLLERGYGVRVLDTFWFGREPLAAVKDHAALEIIEGDIRDPAALAAAFRPEPRRIDAVIHLACISNDPSFELDPALGRSINLDAFPALVKAALKMQVQRFIYASSSSVYGVKSEERVTEDVLPAPLTDYSRFKLECEQLLLEACEADAGGMVPVMVRPATLCGMAPRLRLDLTVNILTANALERGAIRVFGGKQLRPNLHIADMVDFYEHLLRVPSDRVRGEAFNVGTENLAVGEIAERVRAALVRRVASDSSVATSSSLEINVEPSADQRSYQVDSSKARRVLGFVPRRGIEDAVSEIARAHALGELHEKGFGPLDDPRFHNILRMKEVLALA